MGLSRQQFRRLFDEEKDRLFRFLHRICRHRADAEDLLQETFLTVWRKRARFEGRGSPAGYLRKTAYRLFLNARQKRLRRQALAAKRGPAAVEQDVSGSPEEMDVRRFLMAQARRAVDGLPDAQREAFIMFRFEGLSCAEIAEIVDAPIKTVETRLWRATKTLAGALHPYRKHLSRA